MSGQKEGERGRGICDEQGGLAEDEKDERGSLVTKVKKRVRWTDTRRPQPTQTAIRRDQIVFALWLHSQRGRSLSLGSWYVSSRTVRCGSSGKTSTERCFRLCPAQLWPVDPYCSTRTVRE
jgi:hypothetical protein